MTEIPSEIRNAAALRHLATGNLLHLLKRCALRSFSSDEIILREGGDAVGVLLLVSGQVSVRRVDSRGKDYVLALRESGDWIGEMGIIRRTTRSATVMAETSTCALVIPEDAFGRIVLASPAAAGDLLEIVADRLAESDDARLRQFGLYERAGRAWDRPQAQASGTQIELRAYQSFHEATRSFQARLVQQTLDEVGGNVSEAARRLRVARSYIYKLLSSLRVPRQPRSRLGERSGSPSLPSRSED